MEFVGMHKLTGKAIFKYLDDYFTYENESFIKMQVLTEKQLAMVKALRSPEAKQINY